MLGEDCTTPYSVDGTAFALFMERRTIRRMRKNALPLHGAGRGMTFCYPLPRLPLFSVSAFRKMKPSGRHFGRLRSRIRPRSSKGSSVGGSNWMLDPEENADAKCSRFLEAGYAFGAVDI
jgi:hypothetical protein